MPQHDFLDHGDLRSQHDGLPADQRARQRALRFLPCQQQLHFDDCADGVRELRMPFDEMATDDDPGHSTSGPAFAATNCATCHTTKGWDSASFDHGTTGFALTGTHASPSPTPCAACHVNNNYTLNSADCMG